MKCLPPICVAGLLAALIGGCDQHSLAPELPPATPSSTPPAANRAKLGDPETYQARTEFFTQAPDDTGVREWKTGPQNLPPLEKVIAAPPDKYPVYGIYCWGGEFTRAFDEIRKIGFRSARLSGPWNESEKALLQAAGADMEILYTVTNAQRRAEQKGWRRPHFESDEAFIQDYLETASEFLARFGPEGTIYEGTGLRSPVAVFEVLNEPNYHYVIPDREPMDEVRAERASLYGRVLAAAAPLIRERAPQLKIAAFACGGGGPIVADVPFIESVTATHPGIHRLYDILTTHPYMQGAPPEVFKIKKWGPRAMSQNLADIRKVLAADGVPNLPVWYSEVGFPIFEANGGKFQMKPREAVFRVTPDLQAAYIVRQYLWAMRLGVGRVHLMSLFDTDNFNSGLLLREDLSWRPAAFAIQNLIRVMPNPQLLGAIADGENDCFIYRFRADHTHSDSPEVVVAWNVSETAMAYIPFAGAHVTAVDLVGNTKTLPVTNGNVEIEIGPFPVFLSPMP